MGCAHLEELAFCKLVYSLSAILCRHMSSTACIGNFGCHVHRQPRLTRQYIRKLTVNSYPIQLLQAARHCPLIVHRLDRIL